MIQSTIGNMSISDTIFKWRQKSWWKRVGVIWKGMRGALHFLPIKAAQNTQLIQQIMEERDEIYPFANQQEPLTAGGRRRQRWARALQTLLMIVVVNGIMSILSLLGYARDYSQLRNICPLNEKGDLNPDFIQKIN